MTKREILDALVRLKGSSWSDGGLTAAGTEALTKLMSDLRADVEAEGREAGRSRAAGVASGPYQVLAPVGDVGPAVCLPEKLELIRCPPPDYYGLWIGHGDHLGWAVDTDDDLPIVYLSPAPFFTADIFVEMIHDGYRVAVIPPDGDAPTRFVELSPRVDPAEPALP